MINTAFKYSKKVICSMVLILVLMASINIVHVLALSNGIYIATVTPYYSHPYTGVIEDSGGEASSVLGQSMVESATYQQALVEVDANGNMYATVRLQLMDNIQNPQFQVDTTNSGTFTPVSVSLMQEDYSNNSADYRFQIPSNSVVIRCNMNVIAMGRDVVFYMTLGSMQEGSGDFITSIQVQQPVQPTPQQEQATQQVQTQQPSNTETSSQENQTSESSLTESKQEESSVVGMEEFNAKKSNEDKTSSNSVKKEVGNNKVNIIVWIAIVGIIVVAGFGVWYFCFFKKKK